MSERRLPPLLCITGQTASGKSALALRLAEGMGAELLSVDSMQVYQGFDIGTAKPSPEERARVAHHGLDRLVPSAGFSAGEYLRWAQELVAQRWAEGTPVLAVGGTGLYLRALLHGLAPAPPTDPELRARLQEREDAAPGWMHLRLQEVDPDAAERLHPNDRPRLERALEVYEATGEPLSRWQERHAFGERRFSTWLLAIRWERTQLNQRIELRLDRMLAVGWLDEVRRLLSEGVQEDWPPMKALGYRGVSWRSARRGAESWWPRGGLPSVRPRGSIASRPSNGWSRMRAWQQSFCPGSSGGTRRGDRPHEGASGDVPIRARIRAAHCRAGGDDRRPSPARRAGWDRRRQPDRRAGAKSG